MRHKYYAVDFGNSNVSVAVFAHNNELRPEVLESEQIGFHYRVSEKKTLIPSCIAIVNDGFVIGTKAKADKEHISNLKHGLKEQSSDRSAVIKRKNIPIIELCAQFFKILFDSLSISFNYDDRVAFTYPSFNKDSDENNYIETFRDVLKRAIGNYDVLNDNNVITFCNEALATAVGYRQFQGENGFSRDDDERGFRRNVLSVDIGSFSADATYFRTEDFYEMQSGNLFKRKCNSMPVAGATIDRWIRDYAKERGKDCSRIECESVKIKISNEIQLSEDDCLNDGEINEEVLKAILNNTISDKNESNKESFYDSLAGLCVSVLPDRAKENKNFLDSLSFAFTGGTSKLPEFADSLYKKLWEALYGVKIDNFSEELLGKLQDALFKPFEACVTGALWWLWLIGEDKKFIPTPNANYALRLYRKTKKGALREELIDFLKIGDDMTKDFEMKIKLIPAHNDKQDYYHIDVIKHDNGSNKRQIGYIKGRLRGQKEILLDLMTDDTGKIIAKVDDVHRITII